MIARLTGIVAESGFSGCVLDVHGVGYEVAIPVSTFEKLPQPGGEARLFIHTQVREDAIQLFGFATVEEKNLFRQLLNVSGIGGKLALSVLSAMPVQNFCAAVQSSDVKSLSRIPGIGKRTAERLVVELKDKVTSTGAASVFASPGENAPATAVGMPRWRSSSSVSSAMRSTRSSRRWRRNSPRPSRAPKTCFGRRSSG